MDSKLWEDVNEGDRLPALVLPITNKTFVMAVAGTRDYNPVHHNPEFGRKRGARSMWLNTMYQQSLFGRFVTDWTGPDSDFRRTSIHMTGFIHPGDTLTVEGEVSKKWREEGEDGDARVEIAISATTQEMQASRATATMSMPSRESGPSRSRPLRKPRIEPNPEMPEWARGWLGEATAPLWSPSPVSESQIQYWCDMSQDANPLYLDGPHARESRYGGVIAPPPSLFIWCQGRAGRMGMDRDDPDWERPGAERWPPDAARAASGPHNSDYVLHGMLMAEEWEPPDAPEQAAQLVVQEYGIPLRPGDRVYMTSEIADCSPLKRTRVGEGHFLTPLALFYNQDHELAGWSTYTFFRYRAAKA